ncbi:hypothetical protein BT63DRAFT_420164 [Microthyrium microscopicum]|uniref:Defect at low temperature protein 1 n=1 Tax=Microthyrium microscopicum TaxID=703497 RepID=A0A6A6UTU4_9PEZI|nr:hypothetical protein BT63DRAFT_420164 [Microthyrium microscopicum]
MARSIQIPYFKLWYSTAFIICFLLALILTIVSPADLVYQSAKNSTLRDVISVAAVYVATAILCFFIWASRIYTNRAILRDIPKTYVPIDAGEIPKKVRKMIERQWQRSAMVAWDSRPRDVSQEVSAELAEEDGELEGRRRLFHRKISDKGSKVIPARTARRAWGHITHPGWSSPAVALGEGQSIEYWTVLIELPHLLEAKAVSLAPADPTFPVDSSSIDNSESQPDPRAVSLLQRPAGMGLRDYLSHLSSLGVIEPPERPSEAANFLEQYEYARYGTKALTEQQFQQLTSAFAKLLTSMVSNPAQINTVLEESDLESLDNMSDFMRSAYGDTAPSVADEASTESEVQGSVRHYALASTSPSEISLGSVIITSIND